MRSRSALSAPTIKGSDDTVLRLGFCPCYPTVMRPFGPGRRAEPGRERTIRRVITHETVGTSQLPRLATGRVAVTNDYSRARGHGELLELLRQRLVSLWPRARRSTDIRVDCSAVYGSNHEQVSHGFCHCARPSTRCSGTRRFGPEPARLPARKAVTRCDELEDLRRLRLYEPQSPSPIKKYTE